MHKLSETSLYFYERYDATDRAGLTALQKCTVALRQLTYGMATYIIDEYLKLGKTTALECLEYYSAFASQDRRAWISWYVREHRLYALAVAQLSSRLAGPIYTGGILSISPRSYSRLILNLIMRACIILHNMIINDERDGGYNDNYHTVISIVAPPVTYEAPASLTTILQRESHLTSGLMFLNL
jgi:hypothetical protein